MLTMITTSAPGTRGRRSSAKSPASAASPHARLAMSHVREAPHDLQQQRKEAAVLCACMPTRCGHCFTAITSASPKP